MNNNLADRTAPNGRVRAVVFDVGGVLLRTDDHGPRRRLAESMGLTEAQLHDAVFESPLARSATLGTVREEALWADVARRFNLDVTQMAAFQAGFWGGDVFDTDFMAWIGALRPRVSTGLLSNAWSGARDMFVNRFACYRYVDSVVISAEEGVAKPDPEIYRICLRRMGVTAEETVFVDDFARNIEAANRLGMRGILFSSRAQAMAEIAAALGAG